MEIAFTKMHGAGNDYVFVDAVRQDLTGVNFEELARRVSPRHFSVGSDGLIVMTRAAGAHVGMRMYNADGSEGAMCGNGIRCLAALAYMTGLVDTSAVTVKTESGNRQVRLHLSGDKVDTADVEMGKVDFPDVGVLPQNMMYAEVGNPHLVCFCTTADIHLVQLIHTAERLPLPPGGVNVEAVQVVGSDHLSMRVYERGSGETLACGSGACAAAASAVKAGYCNAGVPISIDTPGGALSVLIGKNGEARLSGPVAVAFRGVYRYDA